MIRGTLFSDGNEASAKYISKEDTIGLELTLGATSRLGRFSTLATVISKEPSTEPVQPAGAVAEGAMAEVTP